MSPVLALLIFQSLFPLLHTKACSDKLSNKLLALKPSVSRSDFVRTQFKTISTKNRPEQQVFRTGFGTGSFTSQMATGTPLLVTCGLLIAPNML